MREGKLAILALHAREGWSFKAEVVTELIAEVRRLKKELAEHHCESCDGSAEECRPDYTVRDGKKVKWNPATNDWEPEA